MKRAHLLVLFVLLFACKGKSDEATVERDASTKIQAEVPRTAEPQVSEPDEETITTPDESGLTKAPEFALKDIDGSTHRLSDYRGKVVILDFWGTYCPPCKKEIPDFIDLVDDYGEKGLVILGIVLDGEAKARKFIRDDLKGKTMNYPILLPDGQIVGNFGGVKFIPTTFVITPSGNIAHKFIGFKDKATFLSAIKPYVTLE